MTNQTVLALLNELLPIILKLVALVLGIILSRVTLKLKPRVEGYLEAKTTGKLNDVVYSTFEQAYSWAEGFLKGQTGQVKFESTIDWAIKRLNERGIIVTHEQAEGFAQLVWEQYEGQIKKQNASLVVDADVPPPPPKTYNPEMLKEADVPQQEDKDTSQ